MEISLRYPPVTGRLHTRYAPVRRSSAEYCYSLLPLDLHVLSLPLAFILSQDQTLHCKNCSFYLLTRLVSTSYHYKMFDTRYLYLLIRFKFLSPSFSTTFSTSRFSSKADAKIQPFSIPAKYFFHNASNFVFIMLCYNILYLKKNLHFF